VKTGTDQRDSHWRVGFQSDQRKTIHYVMTARPMIVTADRLVASECDPPQGLRTVPEEKEDTESGDREIGTPDRQSRQIGIRRYMGVAHLRL